MKIMDGTVLGSDHSTGLERTCQTHSLPDCLTPPGRGFVVLLALSLLCFEIVSAAASAHGPSSMTKALKALIAGEPDIGVALEASLRKADWHDVNSLDRFYEYVDDTVRVIPTSHSIPHEVAGFFYMVGFDPRLKSSEAFQDWVKQYIHAWGAFLDSPASAAGLETFYSDPAMKMDDYYVDPSGWLTFNQFFARSVKPGKRPVSGITDDVTIVAPADGILKGIYPVDGASTIDVKGVPYSIADLLGASEYKDAFAGGQFTHLYQVPTDYHRFHVPFAGRIVERKNISGSVWINMTDPEKPNFTVDSGTGFQWRQERGLVVLDTEEIGLVAILPIGMGHVDGVVLTPDLGAELYKGQEFGFFQFGGSDVIIVFQKNMADITAKSGTHYLQGQKLGSRTAN